MIGKWQGDWWVTLRIICGSSEVLDDGPLTDEPEVLEPDRQNLALCRNFSMIPQHILQD